MDDYIEFYAGVLMFKLKKFSNFSFTWLLPRLKFWITDSLRFLFLDQIHVKMSNVQSLHKANVSAFKIKVSGHEKNYQIESIYYLLNEFFFLIF